ncbi:MAG: hypothetical protein AYP45_13980 [Candidatus Brocadia carolinensis]|uniref:Uncharacterized protein n=1 Tax=Candidatus Brocadia carolinensis TaxID=1004156 RepID=A0A1V4AR52_9BACT|nr:MAG: hypothetical protein AYP45_13980 [Candidatus Brocadia caroliniensis]
MIRIENVLIGGLVISLFVAGCGKKQEQAGYVETKVEEGAKIIQQEKQEATQVQESVTKQAEEKAAKSEPEKVPSEAEAAKAKAESIVKELIAKARALLDKGEYEQAGTVAQDVLKNYDSESQEAKDIIAVVTEKLKAMAKEKGEGLTKDMKGKLEGLGK